MTGRPKLLFLCQTLPYPPDGGVHIRTYHVIRLLARAYDITALCFYRKAERPHAADVAASLSGLRPFARVEAFPIPQEHDRGRLLLDHLRSVLDGHAYTWYAYDSDAMRERIAALLASERFDLAHIDSLDLACYLPMLQELPVICAHHNLESALLRRRAIAEKGSVRRKYIQHQAELTERMEREWCGQLALNVTVSPVDRVALAALVPGASIVSVPNGVDVDAFQPDAGRDEGIISVGGINWFPNRDALEHFCADILPAVRSALPYVPVRWVGRATTPERAAFAQQYDVELTGYVDDVRPLVRDAGCFIVPLRVGGGTRLKILDAWAMGKAVVSTSVGCEGLAAVDNENILIRDTPAGFAAAVVRVLRDRDLRARLGAGGRAMVEETYSWEVIGRSMLDSYEAVRAGGPVLAGAGG